jgi:hypothetical protein
MRSSLLYLSEMLDASRNIKDFVKGMEKETFLKDEKKERGCPSVTDSGRGIKSHSLRYKATSSKP